MQHLAHLAGQQVPPGGSPLRQLDVHRPGGLGAGQDEARKAPGGEARQGRRQEGEGEEQQAGQHRRQGAHRAPRRAHTVPHQPHQLHDNLQPRRLQGDGGGQGAGGGGGGQGHGEGQARQAQHPRQRQPQPHRPPEGSIAEHF